MMRTIWGRHPQSHNLTQEEIPVLPKKYNLADGHVHRKWDVGLEEALAHLDDLFREVSREQLPALEHDFLRKFYGLMGQCYDERYYEYFFCTSASMALEIIANYLRQEKKSVTLIEPCFDNLPDIFRRHNIPLTPLPDSIIAQGKLSSFLEDDTSSALCLVSPNNPTGTVLTRKDLEAVVYHCQRRSVPVVIDASFRAYHSDQWDQYALLRDAGIECLVVEDTGKTWPTHELKLGILAVSPHLIDKIYHIYSDMILHVSPFTVRLLTICVENSIQQSLRDVREVVRHNREVLYRAVEGTILQPTEQPFMSVSWLKVGGGHTAAEVRSRTEEKGVYLLPGTYFYWSNKAKGERFLRIALARDPEMFSDAAAMLGNQVRALT